jgi:hypothetical protein
MTINDRLTQLEIATEIASDRRPFTADDKVDVIWMVNEHERLVKLGYANGFNAEMAEADRNYR